VILVDQAQIPPGISQDSVLVHLAAAYFSLGKKLEQKTGCSQTRGFILSTLRFGAERNQNQIATQLGLDRTVVHRAIRTMVREGLLSESKAKTGKAILLRLTAKGTGYRERLIKIRREADEKLRKKLTAEEWNTLLHLLEVVAGVGF